MAGNYSLGVAEGTIIIAYDGKGVKAAEAGLTRVETRSKSLMASTAKVGKSMTKTGLIMAAGLGVAIKEAVDFQQKMNLLVTAAGESPKAIAGVAKGLQDLAIKTGTSLGQLADGMYLAEKAGYRAADGLKVMNAAAEGARAENVDLATFTSALTSVMTSYSYKASDATRVTNMLVRAAGASKTTMAEFAGALATVLPVASALGISFPQVAGAMSVLTQHGTSAREATQELANLIRNLAGQSGTAKAALEQLGVPVIDLQRNLGRRGLTGSLAIVTEALRKHGKAGMIVTSALKQTATGEQAMNDALKVMPANVRKLSTDLMAGRTSIYSYRKETRALHGQAGVMGQQFLALYGQSRGFSNALKSGNPTVATLAATLQKALGGATGLRTALQLGVNTNKEATKSSKLLSENIKSIGDAGKHGGKDIETWAKTSDTAAVKLGRLKAAGQVFGVTMGNIVLPAVTKVVTALAHFLVWLTTLPEPLKKLLGYGTLIAASFLILGGLFIKLIEFGQKFYKAMLLVGKGFAGAINAIERLLIKLGIIPTAEARAAQAAEESALAQQAAADRVIAAKAALADATTKADYTIARSELTAAEAAQRAATMTAEAMAAQTEAVTAGAAEQEAALGGLGTARVAGAAEGGLAGGAGGVGGMARGGGRMSGAGFGLGAAGFIGGSMLKSGHSATSWQGMVGTPLQYAGAGAAIGSFAGPVGAAVGAGVGALVGGIKDVVSWIHKENDAQKQLSTVNKKAADNTAMFAQVYQFAGKAHRAAALGAAAQALSETDLADKAAKAGLTQKDLLNAITGTADQFDRTVAAWKAQGKPAKETIDSLAQLRQQYLDGADAARKNALATGHSLPGWVKTGRLVDLLSGKMVKLNGRTISTTATSLDFGSAIRRMTQSFKDNGTTLDQDTSFGLKNAQAIRTATANAIAHAQAVYTVTQRTKGHKAALQAATTALENDRQRIIDMSVAAGANKDAVQRVIDKLITFSKQHPHAKLRVDTQQARADMTNFSAWMETQLHPRIVPQLVRNQQDALPGLVTPGNSGVLTPPQPQGPGASTGGWIPGPSTRAWRGVVHGREYVLSTDMLRGRRAVDTRVLQALSVGQRMAMSSRGSRIGHALTPAPALALRLGAGGPRHIKMTGGNLGISRDATGELRAWVQDILAEEHDFHDSLGGMG